MLVSGGLMMFQRAKDFGLSSSVSPTFLVADIRIIMLVYGPQGAQCFGEFIGV